MELDSSFYLSQALIIVGYLIFFVSRFQKEKKGILIIDSVSRLCFLAGYFLIRSVNSIEHTLYGIIRNTVGNRIIKKSNVFKITIFIIMLILLCVMYGLSYKDCSTLVFLLSGLINLFAVFFLNEQGIRIGTILAAICNIVAFIIVKSYASIFGEILCGIIGLISFCKENGKNK